MTHKELNPIQEKLCKLTGGLDGTTIHKIALIAIYCAV